MRTTIVEDRILARIAMEAVGWNAGAGLAETTDVALGQAAAILRGMGVAVTPEMSRSVRDDVALILADPARTARARAFTPAAG